MSIKIIPVRFTENGFMAQPFALGGEGAEGLDPAVKYRSCLQNWVIDTGSEVILVDTGLPAEYSDMADGPFCLIHGDVTCTDVALYENRLSDLGKTLCEGAIRFSQVKLKNLQGALSDE